MKGMIKFYAPLGATSVLMMSSHSIVSTGLVRTAEANAALAAHAVAQSIAVLFAGPCYSMQRMGGRPVTRQELLQLSQARRVDVLDRTYGAHVACGLRISGQARFHGNTSVLEALFPTAASALTLTAVIFSPLGYFLLTRLSGAEQLRRFYASPRAAATGLPAQGPPAADGRSQTSPGTLWAGDTQKQELTIPRRNVPLLETYHEGGAHELRSISDIRRTHSTT